MSIPMRFIPIPVLRVIMVHTYGLFITSWLPIYITNKNFALIGSAVKTFLAGIRQRLFLTDYN